MSHDCYLEVEAVLQMLVLSGSGLPVWGAEYSSEGIVLPPDATKSTGSTARLLISPEMAVRSYFSVCFFSVSSLSPYVTGLMNDMTHTQNYLLLSNPDFWSLN